MSKQDLKKELKKINVAIDKRIIAGEQYADLAKKHRVIINLLK